MEEQKQSKEDNLWHQIILLRLAKKELQYEVNKLNALVGELQLKLIEMEKEDESTNQS